MSDLEAEVARRLGHGGVGALFARAVRVARHARVVCAVLAQLVEQRAGEVALGGDGGGDLGGVGWGHR